MIICKQNIRDINFIMSTKIHSIFEFYGVIGDIFYIIAPTYISNVFKSFTSVYCNYNNYN